MFDTLVAGLIDRTVAVRAVECLSVCKRPCTVALTAPGKRTYVVGDLDPASRVEDVIAMARRYGDSKDGIVAWRERPPCFCKAVVA
jgi:predicted metal-binding protein